MKRYLPFLGIGLLCALLITLVLHRTSPESTPGNPDEPVPAARVSAARETASTALLSQGKPEEALPRIKELEKMEVDRRKRDQAAEKSHESRVKIALSKSDAWTKVILTNQQKFQALRAAAAQSPDKMVPCSICDGRGVLDLCVICDHTGKCPTCHGTGKVFDEVCPTCVGSGKCFLCMGSGKMACPFCQSLPRKEVITPETPAPPEEIPVTQ